MKITDLDFHLAMTTHQANTNWLAQRDSFTQLI